MWSRPEVPARHEHRSKRATEHPCLTCRCVLDCNRGRSDPGQHRLPRRSPRSRRTARHGRRRAILRSIAELPEDQQRQRHGETIALSVGLSGTAARTCGNTSLTHRHSRRIRLGLRRVGVIARRPFVKTGRRRAQTRAARAAQTEPVQRDPITPGTVRFFGGHLREATRQMASRGCHSQSSTRPGAMRLRCGRSGLRRRARARRPRRSA